MYKTDTLHPVPSLQQKLQGLYDLNRTRPVELGFRPAYLDLLRRLGNPHLHLPPVIHVAGTNGKGSAVAFMRAILEAAGYKAHVYTSPHLCRFNERIVLGGQEIADDLLESLLDEVMTLNADAPLTFFEVTTALAFAAFAREPADIVLLEVGLGGRLDCTNVIERPDATVITPIGYDHMEFLGDTLDSIAGEKAGIMKPGAPCIVGPQVHDTVMKTLHRKALDLDVSIFRHGFDWRVEPQMNQDHELHTGEQVIPFPSPSLPGNHQIFNAGTAIRVLNELDRFHISGQAIRNGVRHATWPGRLQRLDRFRGRPLPPDVELWLDGAHNEAAARVLADFMVGWQIRDNRPVHLVAAMLNKRSPASVLEPLLHHADTLTATALQNETSSHAPETIRKAALRLGFSMEHIQVTDYPLPALESIIGRGPGRILVTGSLYLVGLILKQS